MWGRAFVVVSVALVVSATSGCNDDEPRDADVERRSGNATVGGDVVSTVDGHPITVADVEALARGAQLSPQEALRRLQELELLSREAERRGYARRSSVRARRSQVAVRAALARLIEARVTPEQVDEADARARYDERIDVFVAPERRVSRHLLAEVGRDAPAEEVARAEALALRAHGELARTERACPQRREPADCGRPADQLGDWMIEGWQGERPRIEDVPGLARDAAAEPEYLEALFAMTRPGVAPAVVRTDYGFHVVVLTEIQAARDRTFEQAAPEIREAIATERRFAALVQLLTELTQREGVERDEAAIGRALAQDLLEPSEGT